MLTNTKKLRIPEGKTDILSRDSQSTSNYMLKRFTIKFLYLQKSGNGKKKSTAASFVIRKPQRLIFILTHLAFELKEQLHTPKKKRAVSNNSARRDADMSFFKEEEPSHHFQQPEPPNCRGDVISLRESRRSRCADLCLHQQNQ